MISISHLSKTYTNGFEALKDVSLDIPSGSFFALLGPNGAGKSTLINILTGLVAKSSGSLTIGGVDFDQNSKAAKSLIGVVPQEFNFSIFEAVEDIVIQQAGFYGVDEAEAKQRCEVDLKALGLYDKRRSPSRTLSGGMKRRLMIARALVHRPKILILDEPTAGVDLELRKGMWEFLKNLNAQGTTILLTTHYLEEAEALCDSVAFISKGTILKTGAMKDILNEGLVGATYAVSLQSPVSDGTIDSLKDYDAKRKNESDIEVALPNGTTLSDLIASLSSQGMSVTNVAPTENRLERVFSAMMK